MSRKAAPRRACSAEATPCEHSIRGRGGNGISIRALRALLDQRGALRALLDRRGALRALLDQRGGRFARYSISGGGFARYSIGEGGEVRGQSDRRGVQFAEVLDPERTGKGISIRALRALLDQRGALRALLDRGG
jgi:hypothetical protein